MKKFFLLSIALAIIMVNAADNNPLVPTSASACCGKGMCMCSRPDSKELKKFAPGSAIAQAVRQVRLDALERENKEKMTQQILTRMHPSSEQCIDIDQLNDELIAAEIVFLSRIGFLGVAREHNEAVLHRNSKND